MSEVYDEPIVVRLTQPVGPYPVGTEFGFKDVADAIRALGSSSYFVVVRTQDGDPIPPPTPEDLTEAERQALARARAARLIRGKDFDPLVPGPGEVIVGTADGPVARDVSEIGGGGGGITPEQFGAVGDGVADDTQAVQDAFDAGAGGVVHLTRSYGFSGTLTVHAKTQIEGRGELKLLPGYALASVPFRGGDAMLPYVMAAEDGVTIRDLTIVGTTDDTRPERHVGVLFVDCTGGVAENLTIRYINWDPDLAGSQSKSLGYGLGTLRASNIIIRGGRFEFGGYQNIGIADGSRNVVADGVYCGTGWRTSFQVHRDVWDVDVTNSVIENIQETAHSAFTIHPMPDEPTGRVRISNTTIKAITDPGMLQVGGLQLVDVIDGLSLSDVNIESNRWGAYVLARGASFKNVNVVSGAIGLDFTGTGLHVEGGSYVANGGTLYAIEVRASSQDAKLSGVLMDATQAYAGLRCGGDRVAVRGCTIRGDTYGVWVVGAGTKRVSFTDNIIEAVKNNAFYFEAPGTVPGASLTLRGNIVSAPSNARGVLISSSIVGPLVQGNTVQGGNVGVRITATASKAIVKDNNLLGATVGAEILAPDSIVQDNLVAA